MAATTGRFIRYLIPVLKRQNKVFGVFYSTDKDGIGDEDNLDSNYYSSFTSNDPFHCASKEAFPKEVSKILMAPINNDDIEIKPDGLLYLPEIKYRRILNESFGPGGWALLPRGESLQFQNERDKSQLITREYALFCCGRYVSQSVGEHTFYGQGNMVYGKAMEAAKSNALVRCCKDLGIASELWDPKFVSDWKEKFATSVWCEHSITAEKRKLWHRSDREPAKIFSYPWKLMASSSR
ncbi:mitochondrial genome maintenance protein mgm101 homolog [Xenia sp. Carnegie-2017]|uniref:mitochondrial genome maintenance protein mgm101 homolog n=1 Tax=Xenia sp. Carnegie-2017 TaxID=2897299 RepID=UPI001F04CEBE|nr:mitochondrial genome maintenance protein mgm101 homolog [Xenia sp. Carnegie-2017]